MKNLLIRWIASALALFLIAQLNLGIKLENHGAQTIGALLIIVLVTGFANAFIRPIILIFAWPINCLTFGLLGFAINVALFWLVSVLVGDKLGFHIANPLSALIGFIAMGAFSGMINFLLKDRGDREDRERRRERR